MVVECYTDTALSQQIMVSNIGGTIVWNLAYLRRLDFLIIQFIEEWGLLKSIFVSRNILEN